MAESKTANAVPPYQLSINTNSPTHNFALWVGVALYTLEENKT